MEDYTRHRDYRHNYFDSSEEKGARGVSWDCPRLAQARGTQNIRLHRLAVGVYKRFAQDDNRMEVVCARIVALSAPTILTSESPTTRTAEIIPASRDSLGRSLLTALDEHPTDGRPHIRDHVPHPIYTSLQQVAGLEDARVLIRIYTRLASVLGVEDVSRCSAKKKMKSVTYASFTARQREIIKQHIAEETHPDRPSLRDGITETLYSRLCEIIPPRK